jgi:ABC-type polysaccharide/polyol phosphate export permease
MKKYLRDLARRKDLMLYLVVSGLKAQHRNTILGYFWWLLDPLLSVLIYYFVVAIVFRRGGPDYAAHLIIGVVVWRWLSSTLSGASKSIVSQAGIITQIYLPKAVFPVGIALSQLVNFGFGLIVMALFLVFSGYGASVSLVWLPTIIVSQLAFQIAVAMVLAYVCTFVRDIESLVSHFSRLWFYSSPVIWQESMIPANKHWLLDLNPMTHYLRAYRQVLMGGATPDLPVLLLLALVSAVLVFGITYYYSQNEHKIIKVL